MENSTRIEILTKFLEILENIHLLELRVEKLENAINDK